MHNAVQHFAIKKKEKFFFIQGNTCIVLYRSIVIPRDFSSLLVTVLYFFAITAE